MKYGRIYTNFETVPSYEFSNTLLCLIFLALALRLLKNNSSTTMIYIIKILQMTEISTFSASILDKAVILDNISPFHNKNIKL